MKKIILSTVEFELDDMIYDEVEKQMRESKFAEYIDFGEDAMVLADWLFIRYTNEMLHYLFESIKVNGEKRIQAIDPELSAKLASMYTDSLMVSAYALACYETSKFELDTPAHVTLVEMINTLCYIQTAIIGQTRG